MILADKNNIISIFFNIAFILFLGGCRQEGKKLIKISGEAQGTTWHISYFAETKTNDKPAIDSILKDIDKSLSTYLPASIISRINNNEPDAIPDQYFIDVYNKSVEISERTGGLFDVTVGPLVNAWGFGFTKKASVDAAKVDSLLEYVNYKMLSLENRKLVKEKPEITVDFNAIAQGYSVDVLADYLESKGITNYLVEIGGEVKARGKKNNENWKVGIDQPNEEKSAERKLQVLIDLNNRALATSGNYRNFYVEDGKKYAHILDPKTGYPAKQNILSATVLAEDGMTADAYATAFMVMGLEQSKKFLTENKDLKLEVFFIYDNNGNWKTYSSESLKNHIKELN